MPPVEIWARLQRELSKTSDEEKALRMVKQFYEKRTAEERKVQAERVKREPGQADPVVRSKANESLRRVTKDRESPTKSAGPQTRSKAKGGAQVVDLVSDDEKDEDDDVVMKEPNKKEAKKQNDDPAILTSREKGEVQPTAGTDGTDSNWI